MSKLSKEIVLKCFPDKATIKIMLRKAPKILRRNEEFYRMEQMEECVAQLSEGNIKGAVSAARRADYNCLAEGILLHFN